MIRVALLFLTLLISGIAAADDFPSVCSRSLPVRNALVMKFTNKTCANITPEDLAKIQVLEVQTESLKLAAGDFIGLSRLRSLVFWSGDTPITRELMRPLTNLTGLFLSASRLELAPHAFDDLEELRDLTLVGAENLSPDLFSALTELEKLEVTGTSGNSIWPAMKDQKNLQILLLSDTGITSVDSEVLSQLTNLTVLNLSGNNIADSFLPTTFATLTKLQRLSLSNVGIRTLDPKWTRSLGSLEELDLKGNSISEVNHEFFDPMTRLRILSLGNNLLTHIQAGTFDGPASIRVIDLRSNLLLDKIDDFAFTRIGHGLQLELGGAPLRQTNKAAFHGVNDTGRLPNDFDLSNAEWGDR